MATAADVNIDLITLTIEENAINKFANLINIHKSHIINRFIELHDILNNKQTSLINELDNILTDIRTHRPTQNNKLRQLRKTQKQAQANITHNELNSVLQTMVNELQDSIKKVEDKTLVIPTLDVKWDTNNYSNLVNNICQVEIGKLNYSSRTQPIWSTVSQGEGQNQLFDPHGLADDHDSGHIYVTDYSTNRIQIFNIIGEYVRTIYTENYYPTCIIIDTVYCYVKCISIVNQMISNFIVKINKLSGNIVHSVKNNKRISCMCLDLIDNISIFLCLEYSNMVLVFNKTELNQTNCIKLDTKYYTNDTTPCDIQLPATELIILLSHTDYPLQCFNRDGILLRTIISKHQIKYALYFCIDLYNNYIVSDFSDNSIKIYTSLGKLITSIGKPGQEIGQFSEPYGISIDLNNRIIICDRKDNYKLQAF